MTHVFIVNEKTFKIHLEYQFAGTGYSINTPDFILENKTEPKASSQEKTFTSMIADISKIRNNDIVAFYVTGCKKIFGFFKVCGKPYYCEKGKNDLSSDEKLGRYLPFRVKLRPYKVFAKGVSEHKALDDISNIQHPYEMCWSLIYRKLTGMRGCSFVTDYEYTSLFNLISDENNNIPLSSAGYTYDDGLKKIVSVNNCAYELNDPYISLDIKPRLLSVKRSHEVHLQAYIIQNYDTSLKELLLPDFYLNNWIGNEVVCSVGEQRIDILIISETDNNYIIRLIELKDKKPNKDTIENQIDWYLKWIIQYYVPLSSGKPVEIIPTIIAAPFKRNCKSKREFFAAKENFNTELYSSGNAKTFPVEYISYIKDDNDIEFSKVE